MNLVRLSSRLNPTALAALAFAGLAVAVGVMSAVSDGRDDWLPNIATELGGIALVLYFVERIVRREARQRLRPRIQSAMRDIWMEFEWLVAYIGVDYAETHVHNYTRLPDHLSGIIERWLAEEGTADVPRSLVGGEPKLLTHARSHAAQIERVRQQDLDVLEPSLVPAIDRFVKALRLALALDVLARSRGQDNEQTHWQLLRMIVEEARDFMAEYAKHPGAIVTLTPDFHSLIDGAHDAALQALEAGEG